MMSESRNDFGAMPARTADMLIDADLADLGRNSPRFQEARQELEDTLSIWRSVVPGDDWHEFNPESPAGVHSALDLYPEGTDLVRQALRALTLTVAS